MANFKQQIRQIEQKRDRSRFDERAVEMEARQIARNDVDSARAEYLTQLERLRDLAKKGDWELRDRDRIELDVFRLRYDALRDAFRVEQREEEAEEARSLTRTNTQLYGSQMWIAAGILLATIVQAAIAFFKK